MPFCPICNLPVSDTGVDLHEVFITRGEISKAPEEVERAIHVKENCVFVHSGQCHLAAQHTTKGKILCARQLIVFEGYSNIKDWLIGIDRVTKTHTALNKIVFLDDALRFTNATSDAVEITLAKPWSF